MKKIIKRFLKIVSENVTAASLGGGSLNVAAGILARHCEVDYDIARAALGYVEGQPAPEWYVNQYLNQSNCWDDMLDMGDIMEIACNWK